MFIRIILFLLTIISIASCSGRSVPEVTEPMARIDLQGVSILPPQEKGWKVLQKKTNGLHLTKRIAHSDTSYVASVVIIELPDIESKEQFANKIRKFLSVFDTGRFTIIKQDGEISYSNGYYCWRYHILSEDRAAKTKTGKTVMTLEVIGNICQYPKDKNKGVHCGYSQRYIPGNQDPELKTKADEFSLNVMFTDYIAPPVGPKAESDAKLYYNRGVACLNRKQYGKAIADFSKAIELNLFDPDNYYQRGFAYIHKRQYDKAIADFNRAITLNPRYAKAFNDRGLTYIRKRQYDRAISDFNKAIGIDPKYDKAYNNRALAHAYKGKYDQAWADIHQAQILGFHVHPKFLEELRKVSGREQ